VRAERLFYLGLDHVSLYRERFAGGLGRVLISRYTERRLA